MRPSTHGWMVSLRLVDLHLQKSFPIDWKSINGPLVHQILGLERKKQLKSSCSGWLFQDHCRWWSNWALPRTCLLLFIGGRSLMTGFSEWYAAWAAQSLGIELWLVCLVIFELRMYPKHSIVSLTMRDLTPPSSHPEKERGLPSPFVRGGCLREKGDGIRNAASQRHQRHVRSNTCWDLLKYHPMKAAYCSYRELGWDPPSKRFQISKKSSKST